MKQIQIIGLLFIVLLLVACGGGSETQSDTAQDEVVVEEPIIEAETETAVAEPVPVTTPSQNPQECVESYDPTIDYFPNKVNADYAEDWHVTYANHYKVVTVGPVGDAAAGDTETYVLVQCGTPAPELTGELADAYVIEIPIKRLFETSGGGSVVTGLEVLGEADALIGLGYVPAGDLDAYVPAIATQMQQDDFLVSNVGEGGFEAVVAADPDLLVEPYSAEQRAAARELGIPALFYNSFWETPLGGAEHIKFWSLLFNKEEVANELFAPIESDYLALVAQVEEAVAADERPVVLHGHVTEDNTFSTYGAGRIDVHLTEAAGGSPLLVELGLANEAWPSLALEEVIEVAADADFWWNSTYYADEKFGNSISALLADNPLNGSLPQAEMGTTFHNFGRGEDLWKTAYNYRADLILKDLVSILHPELLPDHEPLWLIPINQELTASIGDTEDTGDTAPATNEQGCVESYDPTVDYFPNKVEAQYTKQWSVTYHNHYKVITVDSTYDDPATAPLVERYVLVQCGTPVPEELATAEDTLIIEVPVKRMIEAGGGVLGAVEMLDLLDPLVAWRDQFTTGVQYLPNINAKYAAGEVGDIGEYGSGWEATLNFEPDLLIAYDNRETIEEARSLGVPYVFFSPFSEGPLGSAEQLKFLSLFFNVEAEANEQFNPIADEYLRLRDLAQAQPEKPSVLLGNINGQGAFNTRPYNRIESILIEDAGGVRALDESLFDYSGFFPSVSLEVALEQGAEADYWFSMAYLPAEESAAEFIAADPLNGEFQALLAGNMFHRFGRDEDYFRTPAIRVDELLADMISILHPDLLPEHEVIHLDRVPGGE